MPLIPANPTGKITRRPRAGCARHAAASCRPPLAARSPAQAPSPSRSSAFLTFRMCVCRPLSAGPQTMRFKAVARPLNLATIPGSTQSTTGPSPIVDRRLGARPIDTFPNDCRYASRSAPSRGRLRGPGSRPPTRIGPPLPAGAARRTRPSSPRSQGLPDPSRQPPQPSTGNRRRGGPARGPPAARGSGLGRLCRSGSGCGWGQCMGADGDAPKGQTETGSAAASAGQAGAVNKGSA